jgi:hypothetical protein
VTGQEATLAVIDALNALGAPYMVVGSFSSNYYGVPRATQDADFVLVLQPGLLQRLAQRLGPEFKLDPQASFETVTATQRHVIRIPPADFYVELFGLSDDEFDQERFRRRVCVRLWDREAFLPTAEDVVVSKLLWALHGGRGKDFGDVRGLVSIRGAGLDWPYIHGWCDRHGTRALLEEIRGSLAPGTGG